MTELRVRRREGGTLDAVDDGNPLPVVLEAVGGLHTTIVTATAATIPGPVKVHWVTASNGHATQITELELNDSTDDSAEIADTRFRAKVKLGIDDPELPLGHPYRQRNYRAERADFFLRHGMADYLRDGLSAGRVKYGLPPVHQSMRHRCEGLLLHFFYHQTHHRTQVHAMITQSEVSAPVLDLHRVLISDPT